MPIFTHILHNLINISFLCLMVYKHLNDNSKSKNTIGVITPNKGRSDDEDVRGGDEDGGGQNDGEPREGQQAQPVQHLQCRLNPNSIWGGEELFWSCDAKFCEKWPCSNNNYTALIKQICLSHDTYLKFEK